MVLTKEDYQQAIKKRAEMDLTTTLDSLFDLRTTTESYIIQCLADREIQKLIQKKGERRSPAYGHNSMVIHSPHTYAEGKAADDLGWNSTTFKPLPIRRLLRNDAENQETSNRRIQELEKQLTGKNNEMDYWKATTLALRKEKQQLLNGLRVQNVEIHQLRYGPVIPESAQHNSDFMTLPFRIFQNVLGIAFKFIMFIGYICFILFLFILLAEIFINYFPNKPPILNIKKKCFI